MVALQADADLEVFLLGLPRGCQHLANALAIDSHRLLHEDVLALLDCLGKVNRPKARRRRQDDHVGHADGLLVGVETDELVLLLHVRLQAVFSFQPLVAAVHAVAERIGHGNEFNVAGGAEGLISRSGATATAADQRHLDGVTGLGERSALN